MLCIMRIATMIKPLFGHHINTVVPLITGPLRLAEGMGAASTATAFAAEAAPTKMHREAAQVDTGHGGRPRHAHVIEQTITTSVSVTSAPTHVWPTRSCTGDRSGGSAGPAALHRNSSPVRPPTPAITDAARATRHRWVKSHLDTVPSCT